MLSAHSYKTKQFLLVLIKSGLVVAAFYFIYTKLFDNDNLTLPELFRTVIDLNRISLLSLFLVVILSGFNWFFEIKKWQTLAVRVTLLSFKAATAQTLGALTASLMTPNRIGEYGAKAMYYPKAFRKKIMFLNFVGNAAQMAITTVFGTLGLLYISLQFQPPFNAQPIFLWLIFLCTMALVFTVIHKNDWYGKKKRKMRKLFRFSVNLSLRTKLKTVGYSLLRYLIFSFQFYYFLFLFGVPLFFVEILATIFSMYLLSSIIPSVFIVDVIVKGGVAMFVFSWIGVPEPIVLSIVTLMWIFNVVLPSMVGSYYVLTFKLPKAVS